MLFDANNPGVWAYHCHILYHLANGMFTVVNQRECGHTTLEAGQHGQLENPLKLNNATAFWRDMTSGLLVTALPATSQ